MCCSGDEGTPDTALPPNAFAYVNDSAMSMCLVSHFWERVVRYDVRSIPCLSTLMGGQCPEGANVNPPPNEGIFITI